MIDIIKSTISGDYPTLGTVEDADCVIGQSFGMKFNEYGERVIDRVNLKLAQFAIEKVGIQLPTLLQIEIAMGYKQETGLNPTLCIDQHSKPGKYLDCWEVLNQAQDYMQEHDLNHPLLLAQSHHIARFTRQALSHGMDPVVLPGLTNEYDENSAQAWTTSYKKWRNREIPELFALKALKRL